MSCAWSDEKGADLPPARSANCWYAAHRARNGYWNKRDKTRATFDGVWTHTGDKYIRDADGFYHIAGAPTTCSRCRGIWVSPFEVESALVSHASGA